MRAVLLSLALLVASIAQPAFAAWHEASSKHFIIYADEKPERLRDFATKLEKFDKAVRLARNMQDYDFGDGNRLTIFVVRDLGTVEKLAGTRNIAGFYVGRATGSLAVVAKSGFSDSDEQFGADLILFHEYAHHLMLQDIDQPLPHWLVEGFAEMMSTAKFEKDGGIWLGRAAHHRAEGLFWGEAMPLETLLGGKYGAISDGMRESVYGRGWLLTHYLNFEPSRRGQLTKYVTSISQGVDSLQAARAAFGDIKRLELDLGRYQRQRRINALRIPAESLVPPPVEVTRLSAGAAEIVPLRLQSKLGVTDKTAEPLAARVRAVRAKHPGDPLVEITLAEAELDAGHPAASEAAADRALAADPRSTEAMIYKGRAIAARALAAPKPDARLVSEARSWLLKANKADPEDPEPLMEYYKSFLEAGEMPPRNAIEALHYASDLAPQDMNLRLNSALQYLRDKQLKQARRALVPIAFNPHGGKIVSIARTMVERIDASDADGALKLVESPQRTEPAAEAGK